MLPVYFANLESNAINPNILLKQMTKNVIERKEIKYIKALEKLYAQQELVNSSTNKENCLILFADNLNVYLKQNFEKT